MNAFTKITFPVQCATGMLLLLLNSGFPTDGEGLAYGQELRYNGVFLVEYYANPDLDGMPEFTKQHVPDMTGNYAIDRNWERGAPDGMRACVHNCYPGALDPGKADCMGCPVFGPVVDFFSVRWTGKFLFAESGHYVFKARWNGDIKLSVDGKTLIRRSGNYSARGRQNDLHLDPGEHTIQVEYRERGGDGIVRVWWKRQ